MPLLHRIKRIAKKALPHRQEYYYRMLFQRVSASELSSFFKQLGIQKGKVVFIQSAFSRLGYFPPGARGFIELLHQLVGEQGTLLMPAFTFGGSMQDYIESTPHFYVTTSPSRVGYLTEQFRRYPGVVRSVHPTHSICALGKHAQELLEGHEKASGPCGPESPLGRLAELDALMLRVGTGSLTLYHHIQELVQHPHLFLPESAEVPCTTSSGEVIPVRTFVYRKQIPNILFIDETETGQLLTVHPSNFPLLYSGDREERLRQDLTQQKVLATLLSIRAFFQEQGWLQRGQMNGCVCEVFTIKHYINYAVEQETALLERFKDRYELSSLQQLYEQGGYPPK